VLQKFAVYFEWDNLAKNILDINKAEMCPFEKLAQEISDPAEAYEKLGALQKTLLSCQ